MQIEKMTAKQLNVWIDKLKAMLVLNLDQHSKQLYNKWLNEALEEKTGRFNRRMNYLNGGYYGYKN